MKAELKSYNQSPRKVRLVTDLVKGKSIEEALAQLAFLPKRASLPIAKLIASAVANATAKGADPKKLRVKKKPLDSWFSSLMPPPSSWVTSRGSLIE